MESQETKKPLPVRTAIFPVAGLGTRFLPATKATPKELLPVLDRPLIQFAIDEARAAGIEKMIFVSHPSKFAIEKYVLHDAELDEQLCAKGKHDLAQDLRDNALDPDRIEVCFVMQDEPLGLGHAVLCAESEVLPGPVAVILPDDLIMGETGCLSEMIAAYERGGAGHMVATMQVDAQAVKSYGILSVTGRDDQVLWADGMVEKPDPENAPSRQAVVGRYVLDASVFDDLRGLPPGAGGEIQLTDAISNATARVGLSGFRFSGDRFDCGSKEGMLRAILAYANARSEYRETLEPECHTQLAAE